MTSPLRASAKHLTTLVATAFLVASCLSSDGGTGGSGRSTAGSGGVSTGTGAGVAGSGGVSTGTGVGNSGSAGTGGVSTGGASTGTGAGNAGSGGNSGTGGAGGGAGSGGGNPGTEGGVDVGTAGRGGNTADGGAPTDSGGIPDGLSPDASIPPDISIPVGGGTLRIEVWGERTIRVLFTTAASGTLPKSLAVVQPRPVTPFTVSDTATQVTVSTAKLNAQVDKATGRVVFLDPAGQILLSESTGTSARALTQGTVSGMSTLQSRQSFVLSADEQIYGLGQHQQGRITYNGTSQVLQQRNTEIAIPVLSSSKGYSLLWDNPAITTVNAAGTTVVWSSESANAVDYYFMYGPEIDTAIAGYRALTGSAPMFGRWAWGYWQSRERYTTQAELLGIVSGYRSRMIPIDNIVQDWAYWPTGQWGSHAFEASRYPDPTAMITTAHDQHFHVLISVWSKFEMGAAANYNALNAANALYPACYPNLGLSGNTCSRYYDAFSAPGRTLYFQQMKDQLFSRGIDAWWLDATEPELGGTWGEFRTVTTAAGPGMRVFNAYPLMTTAAVYEGQRAASSAKRVITLTRSAYAGQQRNGAVSWSGDINGDFATFARQVPAGINFSLSGIPYWNTDIGGFFPQSAITSAEYQELFLRWFQYGAFCPMFRGHGTGGAKEMWVWGQPAQDRLVATDQLRYRLLPYIYSLSWMVTNQGYTMMRGFVFDFPKDPQALGVVNQFMFGPAIMVNPVTTAGATSRSVYLPSGTTWFDFWTGGTTAGGATATAAAPIERIPLFVRAGSIVPMGPIMQYATETPADPIELRVYPGADGSFTLYEDENDGYNYEQGARATIPMTFAHATKTLTIGARQGTFPGMLASRTFRVVFVGSNHGAGAAETAIPDRIVMYTGASVDVIAP